MQDSMDRPLYSSTSFTRRRLYARPPTGHISPFRLDLLQCGAPLPTDNAFILQTDSVTCRLFMFFFLKSNYNIVKLFSNLRILTLLIILVSFGELDPSGDFRPPDLRLDSIPRDFWIHHWTTRLQIIST